MKKYFVFLLCIFALYSCGSNATEEVVRWSAEVYSEQNLKARDSQRILDITIISSAIYSYFSEYEEYPLSLSDEKFTKLLDGELPVDVIEGETKDECVFGYTYEPDNENFNFRLSTCFEFYQDKAQNDGGIYGNKFEKFAF